MFILIIRVYSSCSHSESSICGKGDGLICWKTLTVESAIIEEGKI